MDEDPARDTDTLVNAIPARDTDTSMDENPGATCASMDENPRGAYTSVDATPARATCTSIAGRYAIALFNVARHERALERTIAECDAAAALLDLQSPYRTLFSRILRGHICGVEELRESNVFQPFFVKFLQLVATNGRLRLFKDIARLFATLANQALNRVALTVYTAEPIPSKYTSVIEDKLAKIFTNTLSITYKTDPRILGGLVVQSDSLTIDASVKHQIEKFSKEALAYVI